MKRFKSLSLKKKRTLAVAGVALLCLTVVGTIAYNQNSTFFNNIFGLGADTMEFVETFDSPQSWQPCDEEPKTAIATNKNATPRYVRMKINEYWRVKDSQTPASDHTTTDLPLTWTENNVTKHYAIINTQNDSAWTLKGDGWYYYNTALQQNESTLSLLESVTFNCEVNTAGEVRYSSGGLISETVPSDYAEATYHLYITFQAQDEEYPEPRHVVDCTTPSELTELYDIIACKSVGSDENTVFGQSQPFDYDRIGVSTVSSTMQDEYPVHYYRAGLSNNEVYFAGKCWQAVRTTSTGGVKLIANGESFQGPNGPGCAPQFNFSNLQTAYQSSSNTAATSARMLGYMYGNADYSTEHDNYSDGNYVKNRINEYWSTDGKISFASDVEWDGTKYVLSGDIIEVNDKYSGGRDVANGHRYTCYRASTECPGTVDYLVYITSSEIYSTNYAISLYNGRKLEDYKNNIFANQHDSLAKEKVDEWYSQNMTAYTNKLEDTPFCSDRSFWSGGLSGRIISEYDAINSEINFYRGWNGGRGRNELYDNNAGKNNPAHPSLACSKADSFTVSESNGNGELEYPVGLLTIDEVLLAYNSTSSYLDHSNYSIYEWTMSPAGTSVDNNTWVYVYGQGGNTYAPVSSTSYYNRNLVVRPVVSLKPSTKITSGTGDYLNPWVIE